MSLVTWFYPPDHFLLKLTEAREETRMSHTSFKTERFPSNVAFSKRKQRISHVCALMHIYEPQLCKGIRTYVEHTWFASCFLQNRVTYVENNIILLKVCFVFCDLRVLMLPLILLFLERTNINLL